jgi:hypothetical protein
MSAKELDNSQRVEQMLRNLEEARNRETHEGLSQLKDRLEARKDRSDGALGNSTGSTAE